MYRMGGESVFPEMFMQHHVTGEYQDYCQLYSLEDVGSRFYDVRFEVERIWKEVVDCKFQPIKLAPEIGSAYVAVLELNR